MSFKKLSFSWQRSFHNSYIMLVYRNKIKQSIYSWKNSETDMLDQLRETVNDAREHDYRITGRIGARLFLLASDYAYFKVGVELEADWEITAAFEKVNSTLKRDEICLWLTSKPGAYRSVSLGQIDRNSSWLCFLIMWSAHTKSTARQWIARLEENDLRIIRINLPGYSDSYSNDATVFLCQLRGCYHSELQAMRQDLLSYSS